MWITIGIAPCFSGYGGDTVPLPALLPPRLAAVRLRPSPWSGDYWLARLTGGQPWAEEQREGVEMARAVCVTDQEQDTIDAEAASQAATLLAELEQFWGRAMVQLIARELLRLARAEDPRRD